MEILQFGSCSPVCAARRTRYVFDQRRKHLESFGGGGHILLARWTSNFDCGYETEWWYCLKDDPFDLNALKANRRYKINKGKRNFTVKKIDPKEYAQELVLVQIKAFAAYPAKYRPVVNKEAQIAGFAALSKHPDKDIVLGAFDAEGILSGYCHVVLHEGYCNLSSQKADPDKEKLQINAALVAGVLENLPVGDNYYVCDGERNIQHETHFQDYLEKYFGFRKAYCRLNIAYNPQIAWLVKVIYPFRKYLRRFDKIGLVHKINGIMKMEEIVRKQQ